MQPVTATTRRLAAGVGTARPVADPRHPVRHRCGQTALTWSGQATGVCKARPVRAEAMPKEGEDFAGGRLRVAVEATALLGVPTGVGRFCQLVLPALASRLDLAVSAFAVSWRRRNLLGERLPAALSFGQRAMPARPLQAAWSRSSWPPVEWFVGQTDVVHGTNFVVPPARRAARVVTVHDLTTVRFPELCDRSTLAFPALVRRAIAQGAWVHTPSQAVADEVVAEMGADPSRVRAVHHGLPPAVVPSPGPVGRVLALPRGTERYVLGVGTIEPRKDFPGLVWAFDRVADEEADLALVIAGPDGWGTADLAAALATCRHADRVVRTGWLDDADLALVLAGATVLAYPSRYEGFGFPPLEAMAAGVPVVATAVPAVAEVVGDGALLVPPGDPDALAHALAQTARGRQRSALVERGRRRAALFTWEACAAGLDALYHDAWAEWSGSRRRSSAARP